MAWLCPDSQASAAASGRVPDLPALLRIRSTPDEKVKTKEAKEAVDTAVRVAKAIVNAMNSAEMRSLFEQLKTLLDQIYASRPQTR